MSASMTKPKSSAMLREDQCEIHFALGGFWDLEGIKEFLEGLNKCAMPLAMAQKPIYAIGDYSGFIPQNAETAEAIRDHLEFAKNYGLKRIAIVNASVLGKLQYKRISEGMDVEFFDNQDDALAWLRKDR